VLKEGLVEVGKLLLVLKIIVKKLSGKLLLVLKIIVKKLSYGFGTKGVSL
jgi:hypothetical protein